MSENMNRRKALGAIAGITAAFTHETTDAQDKKSPRDILDTYNREAGRIKSYIQTFKNIRDETHKRSMAGMALPKVKEWLRFLKANSAEELQLAKKQVDGRTEEHAKSAQELAERINDMESEIDDLLRENKE